MRHNRAPSCSKPARHYFASGRCVRPAREAIHRGFRLEIGQSQTAPLGTSPSRRLGKLAKIANPAPTRGLTKKVLRATGSKIPQYRSDEYPGSIRHEWSKTHVGATLSRNHAGESARPCGGDAAARPRRWPTSAAEVGRLGRCGLCGRPPATQKCYRAPLGAGCSWWMPI